MVTISSHCLYDFASPSKIVRGLVLRGAFLALIYLPFDFASKDYKLTWLCFSVTHRVTKAGRAFYEAMRKLQSLRLTEHVEQSGANLLGDAVRAHLKHASRVHEINNVGSNGGEDGGYNSFLA